MEANRDGAAHERFTTRYRMERRTDVRKPHWLRTKPLASLLYFQKVRSYVRIHWGQVCCTYDGNQQTSLPRPHHGAKLIAANTPHRHRWQYRMPLLHERHMSGRRSLPRTRPVTKMRNTHKHTQARAIDRLSTG